MTDLTPRVAALVKAARNIRHADTPQCPCGIVELRAALRAFDDKPDEGADSD